MVFDLDETLIRSEFRFKEGFDKKMCLPCKLSWTGRTSVYLFFRPYLDQMLKVLKKHFELIIFTAAQHDYATKIVEMLEKDGPIFDHVLH